MNVTFFQSNGKLLRKIHNPIVSLTWHDTCKPGSLTAQRWGRTRCRKGAEVSAQPLCAVLCVARLSVRVRNVMSLRVCIKNTKTRLTCVCVCTYTYVLPSVCYSLSLASWLHLREKVAVGPVSARGPVCDPGYSHPPKFTARVEVLSTSGYL